MLLHGGTWTPLNSQCLHPAAKWFKFPCWICWISGNPQVFLRLLTPSCVHIKMQRHQICCNLQGRKRKWIKISESSTFIHAEQTAPETANQFHPAKGSQTHCKTPCKTQAAYCKQPIFRFSPWWSNSFSDSGSTRSPTRVPPDCRSACVNRWHQIRSEQAWRNVPPLPTNRYAKNAQLQKPSTPCKHIHLSHLGRLASGILAA